MKSTLSNNIDEARNEFQKLFEKSPEEQVEHQAQMLSYIFLSEAQKAIDRKGWTRKRLADEIGTTASYLTQLFRGDRLLNFKTVAKIETALGIEYKITATATKRVDNRSGASVDYRDKEGLQIEKSQVNEPEN
jgi:ribosome-binding protein aMBF1 (putative translation factor)